MIKRLHLSHLGAVATRTALITTAIVLVLYAAIAVVVLAIVQHNLTASVDSNLTASLQSVQTQVDSETHHGGPGGPTDHGYPQAVDQGPRFAAPVLQWTVFSDGHVTSQGTSATLPDDMTSVGSPTTVTVDGADIRLTGATVTNGNRVVVGQSMASVYATRSQLIVAELFVGPVLLVVVFLGALAIGRRVGRPIERARRRQMEFTADASHELRTPLSVIEAQTHLALAQPRDAAWNRRAFQRVEVESSRIRRLVEDLLWLARFDATTGGHRPEPVDLGSLARGAVDRFSTVAEARGLTLSLSVSSDSAVVNAPPEWLDRLLGVLLDNACKYSPEGGGVRVLAGVEGSRARLCVEDSGPGIPAGERGRIFDRFHRATDAPGGAGLGLAIADAVVKGSGGRWEIGDAPGGGASMAVSWPRGLAPSRGGAPTAVRTVATW